MRMAVCVGMAAGRAVPVRRSAAVDLMNQVLELFVVCLPPALWGWWRPKGLKPERYLGYMLRQRFEEHPHAGEFGASQVAGETVVEGTHPPQGAGRSKRGR